MSLQHYIDAFSSLKMNKSGDVVSPHKVCMLLAVMNLVKEEEITINRIYLNDKLKIIFTTHFDLLRRGNDQNTPYHPFYHLRSSGFWHHRICEGMDKDYAKLGESNSENRTSATIKFAHVDPELFEYFKSYNARESLKAALADNFNEELRDSLLNPITGWSWLECEAIVKDYFEMLEVELKCKKYNKSEHNKNLRLLLNNRTKGSIERKHQNISAVLKEMGMPIIDGYKPLSNYQKNILPDVIGAHLAKLPEIENLIENINQQSEEIPTVDDILNCLVEPPEAKSVKRDDAGDYEPGRYKPKKVNYIEREASNQKLGLSGEQFIVNYEKARLIFEGKESLSEQITQVSLEDDSLGFDIHSFEQSGKDKFIEVKTTKYARYTQFYVTKNEVKASEKLDEQYHLYRVFNFRNNPRFFQFRGDLKKNFKLKPTVFSASVQ